MNKAVMKEYVNSRKEWKLDGKLHREDGPAIEYPNGDKYWYINDKLHREDGPAITFLDGSKYWYLNGKRVTEQEVMNRHFTKGIKDAFNDIIEGL